MPVQPGVNANLKDCFPETPPRIIDHAVNYGAFPGAKMTGGIHEVSSPSVISFSDGSSVHHIPPPSPVIPKETPVIRRTSLNAEAGEFTPGMPSNLHQIAPGKISSPTVDPRKQTELPSSNQQEHQQSVIPGNLLTSALPSTWPNQTPLEQTLLQKFSIRYSSQPIQHLRISHQEVLNQIPGIRLPMQSSKAHHYQR